MYFCIFLHLYFSTFPLIYYLLSTVYCLLSTVYYLLFTVYCLLSTVYGLLYTVYCIPSGCDMGHRWEFSPGERLGAGPDVGLCLLDWWPLQFLEESKHSPEKNRYILRIVLKWNDLKEIKLDTNWKSNVNCLKWIYYWHVD